MRKKDHYHIRKRVGHTYISLCNMIFPVMYEVMSNDNIRFMMPKPYEVMVFSDGVRDYQYRFKFKNQAIKKYNQLIKDYKELMLNG